MISLFIRTAFHKWSSNSLKGVLRIFPWILFISTLGLSNFHPCFRRLYIKGLDPNISPPVSFNFPATPISSCATLKFNKGGNIRRSDVGFSFKIRLQFGQN